MGHTFQQHMCCLYGRAPPQMPSLEILVLVSQILRIYVVNWIHLCNVLLLLEGMWCLDLVNQQQTVVVWEWNFPDPPVRKCNTCMWWNCHVTVFLFCQIMQLLIFHCYIQYLYTPFPLKQKKTYRTLNFGLFAFGKKFGNLGKL